VVTPAPLIRRALLALALLVTLGAALAPRAGAFVYWSQGFAIGRANLDASALQVTWIPVQPLDTCGVAVDGSHIYWSGLGAIGRANLDGTNPEPFFLPTPENSCGIAVDGSHIYWANRTAIGRANLDGTGNDPAFIPKAALFISGIAVDGSHIYWGNNGFGAIGRADLNGANVLPSYISAPGDPCAVALDANRVYWSNAQSNSSLSGVYSAPLRGKTEAQKLINAPAGCGVAVNSQNLYWSTESPRAIGRAGLDGSSPDFAFIAGGASASGIALDSLSAPPLFSLGKAHLKARLGTATLRVNIAVGGRYQLNGKGVRNFARTQSRPGTYVLAVIPVGAKKHKLEETGKAKVRLSVNFRPTGGTPQPELERTLTLRLRG
jgi:hypothetical protein